MWLLNKETANALAHARQLKAQPTQAQLTMLSDRQAEDEGKVVARDGELPRGMSVAGSVAQIRIEGVLTKTPDFFSLFFGGGNTTYRGINNALALAQSDPAIKSAMLYIDSPGGNVDGLFETLAAIESFRAQKPLSVKAANAQSAAFAIAAVAGRIEAIGVASNFGSIGTATSYFVDDSIIDITNSDSPDKRPDPTTEEGKAVVVRYLDAVNELFVDAIARGRGNGVTVKEVKENYGRGATLLAGEAKKRGMIDSIAKPALRAVGGQTTAAEDVGGMQEKEQKMDLRTLKATHPDVYDAAKAEGVAEERDRVDSHITIAESLGPVSEGMAIAIGAMRKGDKMTMTAMARYNALALNVGARSTRQQESDQAGTIADNAATPPTVANKTTQPDMGDLVVAELKKRGGLGA